MATRIETNRRRKELRNRLVEACRNGKLNADEPLPTMRDLAVQSRLSLNSVCDIVGELAEQGVLHTLRGMGTFPGSAPASRHVFLGLFPADVENRAFYLAARAAFEERITSFGGASLILSPETAHLYRESGELPQLAGVFEFLGEDEPLSWNTDVPCVRYGMPTNSEGTPTLDTIAFDNMNGGQQATRHLLGLGHNKIAFLGLHGPGDKEFFQWSQERETGWEAALAEAGLSGEGLSFCPARSRAGDAAAQSALAQTAAAGLVGNPEISAVVTVNANATQGLFRALRKAKRPPASWPAVVGFDSESMSDEALPVVTALLLSWKNIGREAANILWDRSQGRGGERIGHHLVPMSLIRRFSCRGEWLHAPGASTLGAALPRATAPASAK